MRNAKLLSKLIEVAYQNIDKYDYPFGDTLDRLKREIVTLGREHLLDKLIAAHKCQLEDNPTNSLILYLNGICAEPPYGEFVPIVNVMSDRIAPIDIDIDVSAEYRKNVIDYISMVMNAYPIHAYSTLNKKSAIKDLGKALGLPYSVMDAVAKAEESDGYSNVMNAVLAKYPNFMNEAESLEGAIRHNTIHASGIAVFHGEASDNFISLKKAPRVNDLAVDIDGSALETLGIMKIDILGSATTDTIAETMKLGGVELPSVEELIEDESVIQAFQECNVAGIFQAGGGTNKKVFNLIRPSSFDEVADCISLARPGTKNQVSSYLRHEPTVTNELVLECLKGTRGVLLYQEQVLDIGIKIGGLTGAENETLRRGIGKKKDESFINVIREKFITNATKKMGEDATPLWDLIASHIGYSFNKSHAYAYAVQSFREMYLKLHAPTAFWCSKLATCNENEQLEYRNELLMQGVKLVPPRIENNFYKYTIDGNKIFLPLSAMKGINQINVTTEDITKCNGIQTLLQLFRANFSNKIVKNLIAVGFFDSIEPDKDKLFSILENKTQTSMSFDEQQIEKVNINLYELEKELFGYWITEHPMQMIDDVAKIIDTIKYNGDSITGIVETSRKFIDKKGQDMFFVDVSDDTGFVTALIFAGVCKNNGSIPQPGEIITAHGDMSNNAFIVRYYEVNARL